MIENALGKLNVCDFTTLLAHPNVHQVNFTKSIVLFIWLFFANIFQLENTTYSKYLNTLQLFAYDTYEKYLANRGNYIELSDAMENKL